MDKKAYLKVRADEDDLVFDSFLVGRPGQREAKCFYDWEKSSEDKDKENIITYNEERYIFVDVINQITTQSAVEVEIPALHCWTYEGETFFVHKDDVLYLEE